MEQEEFSIRVSACRKKLFSIARRYLAKEDCEDAVQNATYLAWRNLNQLKNEDKFEAWLTQILMNECRQMLRKKQQNAATFAHLCEEKRYESNKSDESEVYDSLEALPSDDREILMRHHRDGYSITEIAHELNTSNDAVKMRLYRARRRLRIILISLMLLILFAAAAIGSGLLDVQWFLTNRRASPFEGEFTDYRSVNNISYSGLYLSAELTDAKWDLSSLELLFTFSLAGVAEDALVVHRANLGVDGLRHDHIWINDEIIPLSLWADNRPVYTYYLDGWTIHQAFLNGSEDYLPDGNGDAFMTVLHLDHLDAQAYSACLTDGMLVLENRVMVEDYATREILEEGTLRIFLSAPSEEEWRSAYEEMDD